MNFAHVNHISILVAAVAGWIFAGVYYSAMSRHWLAAQGKTVESCKAELAAKSGVAKFAPFILAFIANLVIGTALYGIMVHMGLFTLRAGTISGVICWFGFVLSSMAVNNAFAGRKAALTVIDGLGWLGVMLIIGAIVGAWGP